MLLDSWCRQLRGDRKSAETQRSYRCGVESFLTFCDQTKRPRELNKANVIAWVESQAAARPATVRLRLTALKAFARWLTQEEQFDCDSVLLVRPPKMRQADVADLSDSEVQRILKVCDGTSLSDKRDRAMVLLLAETGLRAAELLALDITDIDLDACVLRVRHGKGDKPRRVSFSGATAAVVDRYVRARSRAVLRPSEGALWVNRGGTRLTYSGLSKVLKARAEAAGLIGFHVHRLRHTAAVRWLRAGGSEVGLMAHAGWTSRDMVARYTKTASEQIAAEEFARLNMGFSE